MTNIWKRPAQLYGVFAFAVALLVISQLQAVVAQSIAVMVNDEPVTSYDIAQRQRLLALSSNLNARMKARMTSDKTKQAFQRYMEEKRPQSREEAKKLQKKFVQEIQRSVLANAGKAMRKKAMDELIDERLMLQAAKQLKISVSDDEVNRILTRMAQSGSNKRTLKEFLAGFRSQGVDPSTLKDRFRAQLAWRQVIRRVYGSRIRASSPTELPIFNAGGTILDVEIVRLKADGNQKKVAEKLVEAEKIRKGFKSCAGLSKQIKAHPGATLQTVKQTNLKDFRGDAQAVLQKASEGEMTPPVVDGKTIELHAICSKKIIKAGRSNTANAEDETQEQFKLYSERHLKDLKSRALLKYPKSG